MLEEKMLKNSGFVKCILMLLVIFGHACAFWSGNWFTKNPGIECQLLSIIYSWLGSFHIYAFTLISGYIFTFKVMGGGYSAYIPFLKNKAKRLLVPYVFVMIIWVAPISEYFFNYDLSHLIKRYILCINPSQLWFLWMLFGVFAIVWPLRKVMMEKPEIGWLIAIGFYIIGIFGKRMLPNIFCIWTACQYVPFFYMGMRIRKKDENGGKKNYRVLPWFGWVALDISIFVVNLIASSLHGIVWSILNIVLTFTLNIVGSIMAWTTLQEFTSKINLKNSKVFQILSSYSMPMYLFHQQIIYFSIVFLNGKVSPLINAGVNFTAAVIGSFLISSIFMRLKTTMMLF